MFIGSNDKGNHDNVEEPQTTTKTNVASSEGHHDKKEDIGSETSTDSSDSSSDTEDGNILL